MIEVRPVQSERELRSTATRTQTTRGPCSAGLVRSEASMRLIQDLWRVRLAESPTEPAAWQSAARVCYIPPWHGESGERGWARQDGPGDAGLIRIAIGDVTW